MNKEEKDGYLAKKGEADPVIDRYRTLNEDAPVAGLEFAWLSKVVGDIYLTISYHLRMALSLTLLTYSSH